jgi:GMP synthase (glutamine-hydrolysing)
MVASRKSRRFAILRCEDSEKWRPHRYRWRDLLGEPGDRWDLFEVYDGHLPTNVGDYAGYVVPGSHYSCTDASLGWLPPLFDFLCECLAHDGPSARVVACCFGHQVVAHALGGEVGPNPDGRFNIGRDTVHIHDAMFGHPMAAHMTDGGEAPRTLGLLKSHRDCVVRLPDGAQLWAHSAGADHEMFIVHDRALAFQSHPELSVREVEEKILSDLILNGGVSAEQAEDARKSMNLALDSHRLLALAKAFLRGPLEPA